MLNLFSKICVFNNLLGPKKCSNKFQSICQNSLWTPKKSPLRFVTLDNTRIKGPKTSFVVKQQLFELFVYIDRLGPQ